MAEPKFAPITLFGQRWTGQYVVTDRTLHFSSAYGGRSVVLGRRKPEAVAKELLREFVTAWWNRGRG